MSEIVAYRIKDYADGWILQESLTDSERAIYAEQGNVVQALVPADRLASLERERDEARQIVRDIHWMARRYADGRMSYAVGMFNDAVKKAADAGWLPEPQNGEGLYAKDGMEAGRTALRDAGGGE